MHIHTQHKTTTQKKDASSVSSVLDASSQSEALQRKAELANNIAQRMETPRPNNTGMPDNLKSGIESLSGFSMDDVRVHYNSSKPAIVQALAYTQGTDIHVAPGQEKHLPHEAWHVAQQKAGRVSPTTNINGMPVNDNAGLEHEADVMGEKAVTQRKETDGLNKGSISEGVCQRTKIEYYPMTISYKPDNHQGKPPTEVVGHITTAELTPGKPVNGTAPGDKEQQGLMEAIKPNDGFGTNPFIKGHLLNHHLGGLGISKNMIPLTANANALHEKIVEQGVKNLLYANEKLPPQSTTTATPSKKELQNAWKALQAAAKKIKGSGKQKILKNVAASKAGKKATRNTTPLELAAINAITLQNRFICLKKAQKRIAASRIKGADMRSSIQYKVQADILNPDKTIAKLNPPIVSLSCSVKYQKNEWKAYILSGPDPTETSSAGNITSDINNFLNPSPQSTVPDPPLDYLQVGHIDLAALGWGGQLSSPLITSSYRNGFNLEGTNISIYNEGTDSIPPEHTAPNRKTANTIFHKPDDTTSSPTPWVYHPEIRTAIPYLHTSMSPIILGGTSSGLTPPTGTYLAVPPNLTSEAMMAIDRIKIYIQNCNDSDKQQIIDFAKKLTKATK